MPRSAVFFLRGEVAFVRGDVPDEPAEEVDGNESVLVPTAEAL